MTEKHKNSEEFELQLIEPAAMDDGGTSLLFMSMLMSALTIYLSVNAVIKDWEIVLATTPVVLACMGLVIVCFAATRILRSAGWGLIATYAFLGLVAYRHSGAMMAGEYMVCAAALLYALKFLRIEKGAVLSIAWMALITTALVIGCEGALAFFDVVQQAEQGNVHKDTLFHASIAAMFKNYGVISTGLNGLIDTPYHAFSHILMAGISVLSGAPVLQVYGVAPWVLFIPILIYCATVTSVMLKGNLTRNLPVTWGVVCALLGAAPWLLGRWAFWNSYFVSESYLISCGLLLLGLIPLFKHKLGYGDVVMAALLGALMAGTKGSAGPIYAGLWLLRVVFLRGTRGLPFEFAAFSLITLAIVGVVIHSAVSNSPSITSPFAFIRSYSLNGWEIDRVLVAVAAGKSVEINLLMSALGALAGFFFFHFIVSWFQVIRQLMSQGIGAAVKSPVALYSLGAIAAGGLIVTLYEIPAGSAYYFTNIAFFVSMPPAVIYAVKLIRVGQQPLRHRIFLSTNLVLFLILVVLLGTGVRQILKLSSTVREPNTNSGTYIQSLQDEQRNAPLDVVFSITPEASGGNPVKECTAKPFLYPAISERPWIGVITEDTGCVYEFYGYAHYGVSPNNPKVTVSPGIQPGMRVIDWPEK